jgi:DDE superfamily endonuclease
VSEADEAAIEEVQGWAAELAALHARIAARFTRAQPCRRVLAYLRGLRGNVMRKNGWQLAEYGGEAPQMGGSGCWPPLPGTRTWSATTCAPMWSSAWVTAGGAGGGRDGVPQEGRALGGVQHQYSGTAGTVDNCQLGVFLAYASGKGQAFVDRELYLPRHLDRGSMMRFALRPSRPHC